MTSNVGSQIIKQMGPDADKAQLRQAIMSELDHQFRPEFLNRLDEIIMFQSLTQEDITRIVDIQLQRLSRLLQSRRLTLELTADAKRWLAERGYDPVFGARPLKRVIQRDLQDPLANAILEGHVQEGDHIVADVDLNGEMLSFTTIPQSEVLS
ncbi:MAG: AAA family ATPase, partial [Anaerolineae bacterium]|nr:AAA family ATPase [Anaerolineae bacterium]